MENTGENGKESGKYVMRISIRGTEELRQWLADLATAVGLLNDVAERAPELRLECKSEARKDEAKISNDFNEDALRTRVRDAVEGKLEERRRTLSRCGFDSRHSARRFDR